jgi:hypothetical protein
MNKTDYNDIVKLYMQQSWLKSKKNQLMELMSFCNCQESKKLVFSLLERFCYIDTEKFDFLLNEVSDFIITESEFKEATTQILAITYDSAADSGQKILDCIKMPLYRKGWRKLTTVNAFGKSIKNHSNGKTEIIIIDEFIGSGKTLKGRVDYLKKNIRGDFKLKCCFLAGIKNTITKLVSEGIDIFCPLQLDMGISEYFRGEELSKAVDLMLNLELKLLQKFNEEELYNFSFGYGGAEALYTMEGCSGNTPNSVFPIFWWLKDKLNNDRNTILTRFQLGFE